MHLGLHCLPKYPFSSFLHVILYFSFDVMSSSLTNHVPSQFYDLKYGLIVHVPWDVRLYQLRLRHSVKHKENISVGTLFMV